MCYNVGDSLPPPMAPTTYQAQIAQDRRAAARERRNSGISADNARIERLYDDGYAFRKHEVRKNSKRDTLPMEMVVYPDLDLRWKGI